MQETTELPLLIPEGIRYNCQGCGRCCGGWSIGLTEGDYNKIKDIDWSCIHPDLANRALFEHRTTEYTQGLSAYPHYTKPKADGNCSFLIDNLCIIHKTLGEEYKPGMCRLFPYSFVPTPKGIYVSVLYSSMAALRNLGNLLTNQRPLLEEMWKVAVHQYKPTDEPSEIVVSSVVALKASDLANIKFNVNLANNIPLSWEEYSLIEQKMLATIGDDNQKNVLEIYLEISQILRECLRLKITQADLGDISKFTPTVQWQSLDYPNIVEGLVLNLICFRNFIWTKLRQKYSDKWTSSAKTPLSEPKVIVEGIKTVFAGKITLDCNVPIDMSQAREYKIDNLAYEINQFCCRALYLNIFGKTYFGAAFGGLSLIAGFNNLFGNLLSSIVFAKALALLNKRQELLLQDLYEACCLAERESLSLFQLSKNQAGIYDFAFCQPSLFNRLAGQLLKSMRT